MVIGVDFDGVLTDISHFYDREAKKFAKKNDIAIIKNAIGYSTLEIFGWSKEDDNRYWESNFLKYTKYVKPQKNVSDCLKQIKELGHKIYIITSRYGCEKEDKEGVAKRKISLDWLQKHDIVYDKIVFTGEGNSKVPTILESGIELFIDDSVHNLSEISKHIPVICFNGKNNKGFQTENMTRLSSWNEILDYLKKME